MRSRLYLVGFLIVAAELLIIITRFVFSYKQEFRGDLDQFWYVVPFVTSERGSSLPVNSKGCVPQLLKEQDLSSVGKLVKFGFCFAGPGTSSR